MILVYPDGVRDDGITTRSSWLCLLPLRILLVAIQWYAIILAIAGKPVGWKGRAHPAMVPEHSTS